MSSWSDVGKNCWLDPGGSGEGVRLLGLPLPNEELGKGTARLAVAARERVTGGWVCSSWFEVPPKTFGIQVLIDGVGRKEKGSAFRAAIDYEGICNDRERQGSAHLLEKVDLLAPSSSQMPAESQAGQSWCRSP